MVHSRQNFSKSDLAVQTAENAIHQHVTATQKDLTQVKSLIDNAIEGLVDSFISLEASVRIQQNLISIITSGENTSQLDELNPFRDHHIRFKQLLLNAEQQTQNLVKETAANAVSNANLAIIKASTNEALHMLQNNTAHQATNQPVIAALNQTLQNIDDLAQNLQAKDNAICDLSKSIMQNIEHVSAEILVNTQLVADEMQRASQQIERDVHAAIYSLQFQDTSTQLIAQCIERQKLSQDLLLALSSAGTPQQENTSNANQLADAIADVNAVRMKEFDVAASSVELFD